uniref:Uncharacterized protein n=1 Tax=Utricularia reniformis TaxID=192314 RepID=A0A1Y0AZ38_9LAMI|nr:hypothetical protein AEK19_MT2113 [Utricularia reniformis]ART30432.1 hypothetical protein AEK19_MT2113 [Utricularia reniformis]
MTWKTSYGNYHESIIYFAIRLTEVILTDLLSDESWLKQMEMSYRIHEIDDEKSLIQLANSEKEARGYGFM